MWFCQHTAINSSISKCEKIGTNYNELVIRGPKNTQGNHLHKYLYVVRRSDYSTTPYLFTLWWRWLILGIKKLKVNVNMYGKSSLILTVFVMAVIQSLQQSKQKKNINKLTRKQFNSLLSHFKNQIPGKKGHFPCEYPENWVNTAFKRFSSLKYLLPPCHLVLEYRVFQGQTVWILNGMLFLRKNPI